MVIVKIQSVVSDLAVHFGFLTSEHAEIVSSSSVYINEQLFSHWITSILVPSVEMRSRALQLNKDAQALIILDGCLAHSEETLRGLQKHHISFHFLPPHSSHITQPLNRGIFSAMKQHLRKVHFDGVENAVAKRVMQGLIAYNQATNFVSI